MSKKKKFQRILAVPVTAEMKDKLQKLADLYHYGNVSELVRAWLEKRIAQESKDHE